MGTLLEFLSGGVCKVVQKDRTKQKTRRISINTILSPTAQEQACLGRVSSQREVTLQPGTGSSNSPRIKPVSTDQALSPLSGKEFCRENKSVSCTVMDSF